jgi:hypothetical protein
MMDNYLSTCSYFIVSASALSSKHNAFPLFLLYLYDLIIWRAGTGYVKQMSTRVRIK